MTPLLNRKRRLQWFYFAPVVLWLGLIFFMSTPAGDAGKSLGLLYKLIALLEPGHVRHLHADDWDPANYLVRKLAHLLEYAVLALLTFRALQFGSAALKRFSLWGAWAFCVLYACSDEWHQAFVPGRTSALRDAGFDAFGAALALFATRFLFLHRSLESHLQASEMQSQSETT